MEKATLKQQKSSLLNILKGYKKANELIMQERKLRLAQLTGKYSLPEYDALCRMWEANPKKESFGRLEEQRIAFLLNRRRLLNKAGVTRKNR